MSAAVFRSGTPSLSIPQTQNTAPVLEFNCLYTHDVRRKQKRWQDGFVRFHTFNKRVMVYDVPRNFIGDAHWKAEEALQDGDEVMLEKDGVIVQVAESVGRTETDLTELRNSRKKTSSEHGSSSPVRPSRTPARVQPAPGHGQASQLKHRSLNALLGTPKGLIGKAALPTRSPYEQRYANAENVDCEGGRPPKRQRTEQTAAWNVVRTTKTAKPAAHGVTPLWARTADSMKSRKKVPPLRPGQQRLGTKEVIDLSGDADEQGKFLQGFSSDVLMPPSSPRHEADVQKQPPVRSSSPAFQTQQAPGHGRKTSTNATDEATRGRSEPQAQQQKRHVSPVTALPDKAPEPWPDQANNSESAPKARQLRGRHDGAATESTSERPRSPKPPSTKSGQTLRVAAGASKKKTLLFEDQGLKKPSRAYLANTESAVDQLLSAASQGRATAERSPKSQRKQLEERLAKLGKKRPRAAEAIPDGCADMNVALEQQNTHAPTHAIESESIMRTPSEVSAMELAQLDQMIMPPAPLLTEATAIPPEREERHFRRVMSESSRPPLRSARVPGAPVRHTPSPAKKSPTPGAQPVKSADADSPSRPAIALQPKPRGRKSIQRAVSLNTRSNGTATVLLSKPFHTPKAPELKAVVPEQPPDPWSREAFDLFRFRPPGWDEEGWCLQTTESARTPSE